MADAVRAFLLWVGDTMKPAGALLGFARIAAYNGIPKSISPHRGPKMSEIAAIPVRPADKAEDGLAARDQLHGSKCRMNQ
jgi:hypothetical protein